MRGSVGVGRRSVVVRSSCASGGDRPARRGGGCRRRTPVEDPDLLGPLRRGWPRRVRPSRARVRGRGLAVLAERLGRPLRATLPHAASRAHGRQWAGGLLIRGVWPRPPGRSAGVGPVCRWPLGRAAGGREPVWRARWARAVGRARAGGRRAGARRGRRARAGLARPGGRPSRLARRGPSRSLATAGGREPVSAPARDASRPACRWAATIVPAPYVGADDGVLGTGTGRRGVRTRASAVLVSRSGTRSGVERHLGVRATGPGAGRASVVVLGPGARGRPTSVPEDRDRSVALTRAVRRDDRARVGGGAGGAGRRPVPRLRSCDCPGRRSLRASITGAGRPFRGPSGPVRGRRDASSLGTRRVYRVPSRGSPSARRAGARRQGAAQD